MSLSAASPFGSLKPKGALDLWLNKGPLSIWQHILSVKELILDHDKSDGGLVPLFGYIDLVGANAGFRLPLPGETTSA